MKHSAAISGVRGGAKVRHNNHRSSRHASIRQAPQNLKIDPALLEGSDGGSAARSLRWLEQSWRRYHALWLSPK
eukprot:2646624-Rhodomonas_salina.1